MENQSKSVKIILGLSLGLMIILILLSFLTPVNRALLRNERINILILGCDNVENSKRADVIILLSYHPRENLMDIVSIPRDSHVHVPSYKLLRINEFFAYGYKEGGMERGAELTRSVVEGLLKIDIPYYVQLDFEDAIRLVDALGGVDLDIPEKMDYDDNWGNLHIHFLPGMQTLNGKEAIGYLRFRKDYQGDIGRMQRNRSFLKALSNRIKSPALLLRLPQLTLAGINLGFYDVLSLSFAGRKFDGKSFRQQQLPGKPVSVRGAWVWEIDQPRLEKVVQLLQTETPAVTPAVTNIRVELWNATRDREAVAEVTRVLRQSGVDVLSWGYYEKVLPHCKIIDRTGNLEIIDKLRDTLNCSEVETSLNDATLTQAVIIIGEDWRKKLAL